MRLAFASLIAATVLAGCARDSCRDYSDYTCEQLKTKTYNVFYYDVPYSTGEDRELYLGQATGLDGCGSLAYSEAHRREDEREGDWSYICCLSTKDDSCAEKHR